MFYKKRYYKLLDRIMWYRKQNKKLRELLDTEAYWHRYFKEKDQKLRVEMFKKHLNRNLSDELIKPLEMIDLSKKSNG